MIHTFRHAQLQDEGRMNKVNTDKIWWRHQIKHFPRYWSFVMVTDGFPSQRPVTRSFDVLFDLRLNKRSASNRDAGDLGSHRAHYDVTDTKFLGYNRSKCELTAFTNEQLLSSTVLTLNLFSWKFKCVIDKHLGAISIRKTVLPGMAIPMLKIRRPNGRLIFNMEIAIRR